MRFHFGVSFRWKTIKKFLFPFLLGLLTYFGFGFFGFIKTYAISNMNTSYNIDMFDYKSYMESKTCGNTNMYEYINSLINGIDWSTSYYQIFIGANFDYYHEVNSIQIYFIRSTYVNESQGHKIWTFAQNNSSGWGWVFNSQASKTSSGHFSFYFNNCSEEQLPQFTDYFNTYVRTGVGNANFNPNTDIIINSSSSSYYNIVWKTNTIDNNSSYNLGGWWYYSSYDLYYASQSETTSSLKFFKTIHINDNNQNYGFDSQLPSYRDIYPYIPIPQFIGYQTELNTFYTNLVPNQLSNYNLQVNFRVPQSVLGFYQTPQEYINNTQFDYICSGRLSNNGYYYYESFPCSLSSSYSTTESTVTYTFNNISYTQNISNYDKIFVTINPKYNDSSVSTTIFDLNSTFSNGYFYNTSFKGAIYERLSGLLTLNFKLYFSSNNSPNNSNLYIDTTTFDNTIFSLGFSNTSHNEFYQVGQSILGNPNSYEILENFRLTRVSNSFDTGIMLFQQNGSSRIPYLNLFFNGGMYISQNLGNDSFYYIDSTGVIQNGSFSPPLINQTNNYNVNSYVTIVNDFIDSMSESSAQFGIITQSFYDSLPPLFQTFIFVVFILFCLLFTYLLIKRK